MVFGPEGDHEALRAQIQQQLELPTVAFDPFTDLTLGSEARSHLPAQSGRFAPLLGMLVDECAGAQHAIDFLHPRRKAEPPSRARLYWLAGSAVAALVLAVAGYLWMGLSRLDRQIRNNTAALATLNDKAEEAGKVQAQAADIDAWVLGDVTWLDELARLSRTLPPADQMRLTRIQLDAEAEKLARDKPDPTRRQGRMRLEGYARENEVISSVEQQLRDENHHVSGGGGREDNEDADYPWGFDVTVRVDVPAEPQAAKPSPPKAQPAES